jgi:hypothetical protein
MIFMMRSLARPALFLALSAALLKGAEGQVQITVVGPPRDVHPSSHPIPPGAEIEVALYWGVCEVTVTNHQVVFEGRANVVVPGRHTAKVDPDAVRRLAQEFVDAGFYTLEPTPDPPGTGHFCHDCMGPTLALSINGQRRSIFVDENVHGTWPPVIYTLESRVDEVSGDDRWRSGAPGILEALRAENFNFHSYEAQRITKRVARPGQEALVRELLAAGVPLEPMTKPADYHYDDQWGMLPPMPDEGWLTAVSRLPDILRDFIAKGVSRNDQADKDMALASVCWNGESTKLANALIDYGADSRSCKR